MDKWILPNVIKSFIKNDAFNYAASISFCALLAIIPLAMIMVSAAGFVLGTSEHMFNQVVRGMNDLLPWGRDIFVANLESIMGKKSHLGIVGVGFLIFIASVLVSSVESAFDRIFRAEKSRNFFHSRLLGIGMIFLVALLMSLPTVGSLLQISLERFGMDIPLALFMTSKIYFVLVVFVAYIMGVVIIPNKKIYLRYAVVGGVIFSAGIALAKYVFMWYMGFAITRYNVIYGSLTAVILTVVWIYYLSLVLLFSAEIVSELQHRRVFQRMKAADRRQRVEDRRQRTE
jgi:membrane protein